MRIAQSLLAEGEPARGWLINSTFGSASRDESRGNCGELLPKLNSHQQIKANSTCCAAQHRANRFACESFASTAAATIGLTTVYGPRRPNAARALWKES